MAGTVDLGLAASMTWEMPIKPKHIERPDTLWGSAGIFLSHCLLCSAACHFHLRSELSSGDQKLQPIPWVAFALQSNHQFHDDLRWEIWTQPQLQGGITSPI